MFAKIKDKFKEKKDGWVMAAVIVLSAAAGVGGTLGTQQIQRKRAESRPADPKRK